ncbi:hypothetical protein [Paenirhodobacter populi]|uniref:Uncharacterized protein n=1 Tax=Paenirhodobacter populi TaxID=2306993 RepID=A0A443JDZ6_9RHOB|nr:hypothetical protein [Sinirhodobacter populi]RWR18789.1 hypothetical protein D2T30_15620 [Sinirhodobacter populi]
MQITFSPQRRDDMLSASVDGNILTLNDEVIDLTSVTAEDPRDFEGSDWIVGQATRVDGELHVTLILPVGPEASEAQRFPLPVSVSAGAVPLPV